MVKPAERHVHFAPEQVSGSHRPPAAFHKNARLPKDFLFPKITPFDHWAIGQFSQLKKDIDHLDSLSIRLTASWTAVKSLANVVITFVKFIFCFCSKQDLCDQWQGLKSSLYAIYSPEKAINNRIKWISETPRTWHRHELQPI